MSPPPKGRVLSFNKLKVEAQFILVFPVHKYSSWKKNAVWKEQIAFLFLAKVKGKNQKTSVETEIIPIKRSEDKWCHLTRN